MKFSARRWVVQVLELLELHARPQSLARDAVGMKLEIEMPRGLAPLVIASNTDAVKEDEGLQYESDQVRLPCSRPARGADDRH